MKLLIPDDWDGITFCNYSVCWPDSVLWAGILRGFLTLPQRGRTWDERSGSILDAQATGRQIAELNLDLRGCLMSCNDPGLENALLAIAAAIEGAAGAAGGGGTSQPSSCCDDIIINNNGGVQGSIPGNPAQGDTPIYGEQPPIDLPPGTFPDGFTDQTQYDTYKCQMANAIIDDAITTLRRLATITLLNITGLGGIVVASFFGAITLGPVLVPTLIAALMVLAIVQHYLDALADKMQAEREEMVCALYASNNTAGAITTIAGIVETLIALIPVAGQLALALKTVAMIIFNTDTVNSLYQYKAGIVYPGADCSGCASTLTCFDFELEQDLLGWSVIDQSGGTVNLSIVAQGLQLVTGTPSDAQHTIFSSPLVNYTIQTGDEFIILYTADPVPYGRALWMVLDGVRTEIANEGTIVDHLLCAPVPLSAHVGKVVSDIEIAVNRFGGGTWIIRRAGFNCACE